MLMSQHWQDLQWKRHFPYSEVCMVKEVSPQELHSLLKPDHEYVLLDVRQPWEFDICHLPCSINIPLGDLDKASTQLPDDKDLVTICHHGVRSKQAAILLEQCGYQNVISLQGGVDAWARDINPKMERY